MYKKTKQLQYNIEILKIDASHFNFHKWIIVVEATSGENELLVQMTASASSEAEAEALGG
jgi:hypothetical protein